MPPFATLCFLMSQTAYTARTADKYVLYEKAVQNVDFEVYMMERFYKKYRNKKPSFLKEDFCGTFSLCCEWVKRSKDYRALGVDLDPKALAWGRKNNLKRLEPEEQDRIELKQANVLEVIRPRVDIIAAFNFSYWIFMSRERMVNYFSTAYKALDKEGILMLDAFGGSAGEEEGQEERDCDGFQYVWEHSYFHPVTRDMGCKIHFRFRDGTKMQNAFVYRWRLWTPPEISEMLKAAGFQQIDWYFEGTDEKTGEGNGKFRKSSKGENAQTWIAYVLAIK